MVWQLSFSFIILIIVVKYLLGISFRKIYYFLKKERVMMKNNIKKLQTEIYKIQCKNWIKNTAKGTSSAGKILENLLSKEDDNLIIADYYGIELKTKLINSEPYISLFSMVPDNRPLIIKEILDKYGWPSRKDRRYKVFFGKITGDKFSKIGLFNEFKLEIDRDHQVVWLLVRNIYLGKINKTISWSFEQLENRLKMKLSYLAIIPVKKRLYSNEIYYKYHNPKIYKFKDFYTFLELLRTGVIRINMKISFYTSEEKYGEIQDKGTAFEIQDKDIEKLFTIIS